VPFRALDTSAIARSLSQIADREGDLADAFFERREVIELPAADETAGVRVWREEGFAVRLIRRGSAWLASRDQIDTAPFADGLRQVARVAPLAPYAPPALRVASFEDSDVPTNLQRFPVQVTRAIRRRLAGFPLRLKIRRHRRWVRVVGTLVAPEQEQEEFYSLEAEMPWGRHGALLAQLDEDTAESVASSLTAVFRSRDAATVSSGPATVILGPAACAVVLHEAVAHALETDTLALGGPVEAAIGVPVGSELLDVLDNPEGGPAGVCRTTDDEGMRVVRRWLLRRGVVEQLLADLVTAHESPDLMAGAGRRGHRHAPPVPRSSHLELLAGDHSLDDLLTDVTEGLFFPEASRGSLDPLSGQFSLSVPFGHEVRKGKLGDIIAPCHLRGRVTDLLGAVTGVGEERRSAGAGWCAKGGVRLPVWATTPALRLETVEVVE
jgi:predicted Zn-dependent protease